MEDHKEIIILDHVTKRYGNAVVINDVCMEFEKGKIYGIIGRNGCGKTLLMKCICGFMYPTSGRVIVNGAVIGKDIDIPKDIGVIIETPGFILNYSGSKNLALLAAVRGKIGRDEIYQYMEKVGLDPKSKKHVGKYSMGMKQKLGIAQAIMENPSILILDEPMNGLDNKSVENMRNLLKEFSQQGTTILLASHNKEDISILCDIVYEMDEGKVIASHPSY